MSKITDWYVVAATSGTNHIDDFHEQMKKGLDKLQGKGLDVEVQFAASEDEYSRTKYALLVGREKS